MQLIDIREITGRIILKSGLHIGAGDTEMHIGGTDNPVIRHPYTDEPYIPGSSLKGKVRSLLEMASGLMARTKRRACSGSAFRGVERRREEKGEYILKIFGSSGAEAEAGATYGLGPTRVSFADCPLNAAWREKARQNRWDYFEVKSENAIDRISGTARNPRFTERVVGGAEFDFSVSLKLLGEEEDELFEYLLDGLKLLEMDALGGSGSRGYGRIKFEFNDAELAQRFEERKPFVRGGEKS